MFDFHRTNFKSTANWFLDVCSGINAPLSAAFAALDWKVKSIDILKGGPNDDITCDFVLEAILQWIRDFRPKIVHLGPPCSTFSQWMHMCKWSTRSRSKPLGDNRHPKEILGNKCFFACLAIASLCDQLNICWTWEQPQTSLMWNIPQFTKLRNSQPIFSTTFDWCEWGHAWRKRTVVLGRLQALPQLSRTCSRKHVLQMLEGNVPGTSVAWTSFAAEYSASWCTAYAKLAAHSLLP